jgi:hypothetical protein
LGGPLGGHAESFGCGGHARMMHRDRAFDPVGNSIKSKRRGAERAEGFAEGKS